MTAGGGTGPAGGATILVTSIGEANGARAAAAALASMGADGGTAGLLIDLTARRPPRSALVATTAARELEARLIAHLPQASVASRGALCELALPADEEGIEQIAAALPLVRGSVAVAHLPPALLQPTLAQGGVSPSGAMLRADLERDRSLTALVAGDLIERGLRVAVLKRPLAWLPARLALLGAPPFGGSSGLPARLAGRLLEGSELHAPR